MSQTAAYDSAVRVEIYRQWIAGGAAPPTLRIAAALGVSREQVVAAAQRLQDGRAGIVLQSDGELLMAAPFSAVPTSFLVEARGRQWPAPCVWDAFGIPAFFHSDARIISSCGCCGHAMTVDVIGDEVRAPEGVAHLLVPARRFFEDIVFT